jgi:microcystin-dependent protein
MKEYKINSKHIIISILILVIIIITLILLLQKKSEKFDASVNLTNLSNEAIQNIASLYANTSEEVVFNNIRVTGRAEIGFFKGIIVMWSGTNIPTGWVLCDGSNNTPDLRGRFVLGSGKGANLTERIIGDKGGTEKHTLTIDEIPRHTHNFVQFITHNDDGRESYTHNYKGNDQSSARIFKADHAKGGGQTDVLEPETSRTGNSKPHENMPPFYVLAYIMKL